MKKTYPTSKKARGYCGWWKHLRAFGKRQANKATRRLGKYDAEKARPEPGRAA